jgi:hypothetical protein
MITDCSGNSSQIRNVWNEYSKGFFSFCLKYNIVNWDSLSKYPTCCTFCVLHLGLCEDNSYIFKHDLVKALYHGFGVKIFLIFFFVNGLNYYVNQ